LLWEETDVDDGPFSIVLDEYLGKSIWN